MDIKTLKEYTGKELFDAFYLLRQVECKTTVNGNKYLDIVLADNTGEISARYWDCKPQEEKLYASGHLVKIRGRVVEWQGQKQVRIELIRPVKEEDGVKLENFVPSAPYSNDEMYAELLDYVARIEEEKIQETVRLILTEGEEKFITHPAALQNHHAIRSGLLYHTLTMLKAGEKILKVYSFLNSDLLYAGIILHDIAKLEEIEANHLGLALDYTVEGQLLGHIVQGIKKVDWAARQVGLDEETNLILQHMILSHHYEPDFGSPKKPMIPEAEVLHHLDILDAKMYDMQKVLQDVQPGEFSAKIWTLDNRRVYKLQNKGEKEIS
ncbi:MAG: 3'-5' exoribonuclease YhaM family protein [Desulfitobacteriia bacterium]|jgi:3'-5' exoribonuclease